MGGGRFSGLHYAARERERKLCMCARECAGNMECACVCRRPGGVSISTQRGDTLSVARSLAEALNITIFEFRVVLTIMLTGSVPDFVCLA